MLPQSTHIARVLVLSLWVITPTAATATEEASRETIAFFEKSVRPLLVKRCFKCHGPDKQKGSLRLDGRHAMLTGGESGPAIEPGDPAASLIIDAINYQSYEMPPTGKLPAEEIEVLTRWVKLGAPWPGDDQTVRVSAAGPKITAEDRAWWAFQPVRAVVPPELEQDDWSRNEIDQFVLAKLIAKGMAPAQQADRVALIRRASFDLIGLPPTQEEVAAFVDDESPGAYRRLIDRLLDSPRYGERWARHWLDLVRYAESDGFKQDAYRPTAWRYRDYVIRSLNDDKPYDQFVMEQLAGDEIAPHDPEAVTATSYLRLWIYEYNQRDVRTQWHNILNDVTDVTADVFLGVGMSCARCHDHKFDPLLQRDYYRLQAFFAPMMPRDDVPLVSESELAEYRERLADWERATVHIRAELYELEQPVYDNEARPAINKFPPDIRPMMSKPLAGRSPYEHQIASLAFRQVQDKQAVIDMAKKLKGQQKQRWEQLRRQLKQFDKIKPQPLPSTLTITDVGSESPLVTIPGASSDPIQPGFLSVFDPAPARIANGGEQPVAHHDRATTGRRTALARWIADRNNPLSTRVIVNRIWQYHFGRGIVATSSDFGRLGEKPSHPELLDWLTTYFIDHDWSIKQMHRLIMTSATYQQTALRDAPSSARLKDPTNRWLWRANTRRLDAEQIRDAMLSASGELSLAAGGPSVEWAQPRRSIYLKVYRNKYDPFIRAFDGTDNFSSTSKRNVTTIPTQALMMINSDWSLSRARAFADRICSLATRNEDRIRIAYRTALSRDATPVELQDSLAYVADQDRAAERLVDLCHVLLNSNEFVYVD